MHLYDTYIHTHTSIAELSLTESCVAFAVMEAAYTKLLVLGYPPEGVEAQGGRKVPGGKGR